jgi:MarR family transcriptional regulator, organic hydroperoxide resistance regulator
VRGPFSSDDDDELRDAERTVTAALNGLELDFNSLLAVTNIFRAATAARNHMEGSILVGHQLSWSAFVSLFVLRVWGPQESHQLAAEAGISGGTLTGVLNTLERRGLARRTPHPTDGRRVIAEATVKGRKVVDSIMPLINKEEMLITRDLSVAERDTLSALLRKVLRTLDDFD